MLMVTVLLAIESLLNTTYFPTFNRTAIQIWNSRIFITVVDTIIQALPIFIIAAIYRKQIKKTTSATKNTIKKSPSIPVQKKILIMLLTVILACSLTALFNIGGRAHYEDKNVFSFIIMAFIAPILEEYYFRRLYFQVLPDFGTEAAFLNAVCFISAHILINTVHFPLSSIMSLGTVSFLTISFIYVKTHSYLIVVVVHSFINIFLYMLRNTAALAPFINNHFSAIILVAIISGGILFLFFHKHLKMPRGEMD